jgi:Yip1 domain
MGRDHNLGEGNPYAPPQVAQESIRPGGTATEGIDLAAQNPYFTIWTRPRATIRGIVNTDRSYRVVPLAMIEGIAVAVKWAADLSAGDRFSLPVILTLVMVLGPIVGLLALYAAGWLLRLTGGAGGRAKPGEIRAAMAWASVPSLVTLPIWIILIGLLGRRLFTAEMQSLDSSLKLLLVHAATGLLELVLAIWSFVLILKCLAEIQGFSAWKALASTILSLLVLVVPISLLVLAFLVLR